MRSYDDVCQIKRNFESVYLNQRPWGDYIVGCGITGGGRGSNGGYRIKVNLRSGPPTGLSLPSEYQGVEIIIEVVGEIRGL